MLRRSIYLYLLYVYIQVRRTATTEAVGLLLGKDCQKNFGELEAIQKKNRELEELNYE